MTKVEVFQRLSTRVGSKNGYLLREKYFNKEYPSLYEQFIQTEFPPNDFPFKQRLWHWLQNDIHLTLGCCKTCGTRCSFLNFTSGYRIFCSDVCSYRDLDRLQHIKVTTEANHGVSNISQLDSIKAKKRETLIQHYGSINEAYDDIKKQREETNFNTYSDPMYTNRTKYITTMNERRGASGWYDKEKYNLTMLQKYGVPHNWASLDPKLNGSQTRVETYGTPFYSQTDEYKQKFTDVDWVHSRNEKIYETKKNNKSFNTSSIEIQIAKWLDMRGVNYISQYRDSRYPFNCDFYFPESDLFVEIQGSWTHGGHPFNPETDLTMVQLWLEKNSKFYDNAVDTWTIRDVKKRETSKMNNLNYLEIFSIDFKTCVETILAKL